MSAYQVPGYIDAEGKLHVAIPDGVRNTPVVVTFDSEIAPEGRKLPKTGTIGDALKFWGTCDDPTMQRPEDLPPPERDFEW